MIIVIGGPTGVGKTKLSIELARRYNAEIINYDSVQVYKNMDIASAKITKEEMEGIKHHLIDFKNYDEDYTVFDYQLDGRKKIEELQKQNKNIILVGGTGLYIKALLYDYKFNKEEINDNYDDYTIEELYNKITSISKDIEVDKNNKRRLIRTLINLENDNISNNGNVLLYNNVLFIGLETSRDILYERINSRVDTMIDNGLIEEAKFFYNKERTKAVLTPIGYKELFDYFDEKVSLKKAIENIKQNSRHYAKRQFTWFKNKMNFTWFNVNFSNFNETVKDIIKYIESNR